MNIPHDMTPLNNPVGLQISAKKETETLITKQISLYIF